MAQTAAINWQTPFASKPASIVLLTLLQISITVVPATLITCFSLLLLNWHPANNYLSTALGLGVTGLLLNIFTVYLLVSRWVTSIMNQNVSFQTLYSIVKPRLAIMFAASFICSVSSIVCFLMAVTQIVETLTWLFFLPFIAVGWIIVEAWVDLCANNYKMSPQK